MEHSEIVAAPCLFFKINDLNTGISLQLTTFEHPVYELLDSRISRDNKEIIMLTVKYHLGHCSFKTLLTLRNMLSVLPYEYTFKQMNL